MNVYQDLEREWNQIGGTPHATRRLSRWASIEPVLADYATPRDLLFDIARTERRDQAHAVLRGLLRQAGDEFAARVFLQAVVPGLRTARRWPPYEDHAAGLVAATWEVIRVHAGESPDYPARFVVRIAERRLRTEHEARCRYAQRVTKLRPGVDDATVHLDDARTGAEQVAWQLVDALRAGTLGDSQARLLYATAVVGLGPVGAGRAQGLGDRVVYRALPAARAAWLRASA